MIRRLGGPYDMDATYNGHKVAVLNAPCDDLLFLISNEFGSSTLVFAMSIDGAWEEWIDEQDTVPNDELHDAYGMTREEFEAPVVDGEYPDLLEGYEHQANSTGSGIVDVGHYVSIREVSLDLTDAEVTA